MELGELRQIQQRHKSSTTDSAGGYNGIDLSSPKSVEQAYKEGIASQPPVVLRLPKEAILRGETTYKLGSDDEVPCVVYDARLLQGKLDLPKFDPDTRKPTNVKFVLFTDTDVPITSDLALATKHCVYELRRDREMTTVYIYPDFRDHAGDGLNSEDAFFNKLTQVGKLEYVKERMSGKIPRVGIVSDPREAVSHQDLKALNEASANKYTETSRAVDLFLGFVNAKQAYWELATHLDGLSRAQLIDAVLAGGVNFNKSIAVLLSRLIGDEGTVRAVKNKVIFALRQGLPPGTEPATNSDFYHEVSADLLEDPKQTLLDLTPIETSVIGSQDPRSRLRLLRLPKDQRLKMVDGLARLSKAR